MGIKITSVDEAIGSNGLKILVHGQAGSGKTVLAATTGKPTLIISAEAGLLSIQGAPSYIQTTVVNSVDDVDEVHRYLTTHKHGFEWVVLDSITEIAETCLAHEIKTNPDPRKSYPAFQSKMEQIIKKFRDLSGMNVLMTCKQQRKEDSDSGITRYSPMMPGNKLAPAVPYLFDLVLALRVEKNPETKELERHLQTYQDLKYEAKDRSGVLEKFEEPNLELILDKVHDKLEAVKKEDLVAEKDLYFFDEEEGEVIIISKGETYNQEIVDYCEQMSDEDYAGYLESTSEESDDVSTQDIADAKKLMDEKEIPESVKESIAENFEEAEPEESEDDGESEIVIEEEQVEIATKVTYLFDAENGVAIKTFKSKPLPKGHKDMHPMTAKEYTEWKEENS